MEQQDNAELAEAHGWPYAVEPFQCHSCGNCCRGDGYVELTEADIDRLAEFLNLTRQAFLDEYCVYQPKIDRWNLIDHGDVQQSCIFLTDENRCRVHGPAKPTQCTGFPMRWRPDNIAEFCEGWRAAAGLGKARKRTMT